MTYWQYTFITFFVLLLSNINFVYSEECLTCHKIQHQQWQKSDHAKSMLVANDESVKANFNHASIQHNQQSAIFYRNKKQFMVDLTEQNKTATYEIKYTFGHFPLQQYLIDIGQGKLQVLPFSWDNRNKNEGGQRWYVINANDFTNTKNRLHWQQPLQNWNGMCADCHSTGLKRNYNTSKDTFDTHWDTINISCRSCHTPSKEHPSDLLLNKTKHTRTFENSGHWIRSSKQKTAKWEGPARNNQWMDNCFACHSLRAPLTDGITPNSHFLNQFTPQLLTSPFYHHDGQINDEVYVYGSFLQSKMYQAGVNCLDCHDKHTMKLKLDGNNLCLQCHSETEYNQTSHHKHQITSPGAACVNCHMPETTYMGIDNRRDHSFKIPSPNTDTQLKTPNSCLNCHKDNTNIWAQNQLKTWYNSSPFESKNLINYQKLHTGEKISLSAFFAILNDASIPDITKATAITLLPTINENIESKYILPYLKHKNALIRLASTQITYLLPKNKQLELVIQQLNDPYRAVRVSAARTLLTANLYQTNLPAFNLAMKELITANQQSSWRAEGRMNQAINLLKNKDFIVAEKKLIEAYTIEPYFTQAYIYLANLYRQQKLIQKEQQILTLGINNNPKAADIYYQLSLYFIRQGNYKSAIKHSKIAFTFESSNLQYLYTYILLLKEMGDVKKAYSILKTNTPNFPQSKELQQLIKLFN